MPTPLDASWCSGNLQVLMAEMMIQNNHLGSSRLSCTSSVCIMSTQVNTFVPKSIVDVDGIFMRTR